MRVFGMSVIRAESDTILSGDSIAGAVIAIIEAAKIPTIKDYSFWDKEDRPQSRLGMLNA